MFYTLDEIRKIIEPVAVQYGLRAVYIFGSYAKGNARPDSDIDILVDTTGTALNSFSLQTKEGLHIGVGSFVCKLSIFFTFC